MEKSKSITPWVLRAYRRGDEKGILDLCRLVFLDQPSDRFSLDYWQWEFVYNSSGPARIWLADDANKIVGHYAVVPRTLQVNDQVRMGSIVVDVMTHPDYRQQGMFVALGRQALPDAGQAGIEFSYGFPVRKEVLPGHLKVGWQHIFDIPVLVRPLQFKPIVKSYLNMPVLSDLAALVAQIGYWIGAWPLLYLSQLPLEHVTDVTMREVREFDTRFDALWHKAKRQFPVMGARNSAYLNWRYLEHPYYQYRVWVIERGNQLLGYSITRMGDLLGLRSGIIVDMLVDPEILGAIDYLLRRIIFEFQQTKALDLIACMMTKSGPYYAALQRQGLIVTPKVFWFILHLNNPSAPADVLMAPKNWYLTWGDTDVI